jgi:hypothetical protein
VKKDNRMLPLIIIGAIVVIAVLFWFSGAYSQIFGTEMSGQVGNSLALDLSTLQSTIRAVSSPTIEELHFVEAIDTLSAKEDISKLRNPFTRVYVAPPPSLVPEKKPEPKKKAAPTTKRKRRIVRPNITINGIIWDRSRPFAILNNDIYGEGDLIKGYTIQTIQDTMIVLANNDDIYSIVIERE